MQIRRFDERFKTMQAKTGKMHVQSSIK